ncbi:fusaric acid resistance protein FusA [Dyella japonica A8]|uniref:Fusaric acid resistance protein FusA n=1 Tax=Dyella japonica A8 TaxID=1217721 RepID=A0A075K2S7_9GAMM|nr:fusaric acid resistance protein FusA [Dyella japonica A8]
MFLGGCIGTGGIHPRSTLLDASRLEPGAAVTGVPADGTWPANDWWTRWQDPQLDQWVKQAIAGQPSLRIAQARLDLAQAQAHIAGASRAPQLGAVADLGRERYPLYATPSPPGGYTVWSNEVGATLSYDLDFWGKHKAELSGALDVVHASRVESRGVQLALETAVVRAYIELSLQYDLLDAETVIAEQSRQTRDIVARRAAAGLATRLDLSQADAQVANEASQLEQTRRQIALLGHTLAALSGQGPGAGDAIARPRLALDVPIALPTRLPAELIGRRPDIIAQRWRVEAASEGITAAHAAFYPNIDLIATAGLTSATTFGGFFNFLNSDAIGHRVGAAISLPIFDGGRLQGQYGAAVAGYDAAVESYNQSVILAMQQVADQVVSLQSLATQQQQAEQAVASATAAHDLALQGYRSGITEFLNVIATEATLLRDRQQLAGIQARRLDSWALLMQAIGGGLEGGTDATPDAARPDGDRHAP